MSMPNPETRPLLDEPYIAVQGYGLDNLHAAEWTGFDFMEGSVMIDDSSELHQSLGPTQLRLAMLVSLGLPSRAIGAAAVISENTVKTHLWRLYRRLDSKRPNNIYRVSRSSLPRFMMQAGALIIDHPSEPLGLSEAEQQVVSLAASGYTNSEIGAIRGGSGLTTKSHFAHMARNLGWNESTLSIRTALSFAAILSGEIDDLESVYNAYPPKGKPDRQILELSQDNS